MTVYRLGEVVVTTDEEHQWMETRFPDGTSVQATGNQWDPASVKLARELGYLQETSTPGSSVGDAWAMSRDHEIAHTWLAQSEGEPWSPTLHAVAHGENLNEDWVRVEEQRVLDWQRALDKSKPRPWEMPG